MNQHSDTDELDVIATGKVAPALLARVLGLLPAACPELVVPPALGEDGAVLRLGDTLVCVGSDPITFPTPRPGVFAVCVNANDLAVMGARPRYMTLTVLLPCGSSEECLCEIAADVAHCAGEMGVTVIGGHTEVTDAVRIPVLSATMLGPLVADEPIRTGGAAPGDVLIQAKPLALEGTAILASEHREELTGLMGAEELAEAANLVYSPGLSVVDPALELARLHGVHAMHDPTEGGLATGVREMMTAAGTGCVLREDDLMILDATRQICAHLGYSPLGLISSGCLLAAVAPECAPEALAVLHAQNVPAACIGRVTAHSGCFQMIGCDGRTGPLPEFAVDELARMQ